MQPAASDDLVHIDALAYGAHGVGRLDGKVVFVRGVAVGEDVRVIVREDRGRYAYADLVEVVRAAPARRQPPCPYLPQCGGCPWQHLDYASQLAAKESNLRQALMRTAHLDDPPLRPVVAAVGEFGYRHRLSLRTDRRRLGFYAAASHDLIEIDHCLLAAAHVDQAIAAAAAWVATSPDPIRRVEIATGDDGAATILVCEVEGQARPDGRRAAEQFLAQNQGLTGLVQHGRGWRQEFGSTSLVVLPEEDLRLQATAGAFTQVNPAANRQLVRTAIELGAFGAGDEVLELYAGIGNLTFPIARRAAKVVAVEQNPLATRDAEANAHRLGMRHVEVMQGAAHRVLEKLLRQGRRFSVIVLDPPRSGAAEAIEAILRLAPARIVYVSCNPATLARDLGQLARDYEITAVQPLDLFPQTYHLEAVVQAVRRNRGSAGR